jgi:trehalose/maltose hydrolase-like predicted phosphorylase
MPCEEGAVHIWLVTGDAAFLCDAGAEILLETGRFWAGRAQLEADGRCHIRGVIGADEYHEHIDDNAYTNLMARWRRLVRPDRGRAPSGFGSSSRK